MEKGQIVRSLKGRDKDSFLMVVGSVGENLLLCDGKARPLERPKLKSKKHVEATPLTIEQKTVTGNKTLRRLLNKKVNGLPKEENKNV